MKWPAVWPAAWADPAPSGPIIPVKNLTTEDVLYGDRTTSYRWEVLSHDLTAGTDSLAGFLDGVVEGQASLSWSSNTSVKGGGQMQVADLAQAQAGMLAIADVTLATVRLRPVCVIDGLPDIPYSVYLVSAAKEDWDDTGRIWTLELLDRCTVLDQDKTDSSYAVPAGTKVLSAVAAVIASAGEHIDVDASVTTALSSDMVWDAGTSKLQIVNDILAAANYNSLWVDGAGLFQATPYVLPANRDLAYELLALPRELVDGDQSIYDRQWTCDRDAFDVPNKVVAVQNGTTGAPALVGEYTNTDPASPFSYPSRGRWIVSVLTGVEVPDFSAAPDPAASTIAFLQSKAQQSLIASSAVQATIDVKHLPLPIRVLDVMRFANVPAGVDGRYTVTSIKLDANALGLMESTLQEVLTL